MAGEGRRRRAVGAVPKDGTNAALFGFTGIAAASADIARVPFYVFVVLFLVLLVLGLTIFRV